MMEIPIRALGGAFAVLAAIAVAVFGVWALFKLLGLVFTGIGATFRGLGQLVAHVFRCGKGIVVDTLRYVGSTVTAVVFLPLVVANIALGRWSTATHYGRAAGTELRDGALSLYRAAIGHPLRLFGLGALVEGFERRIPEVIARAPGSDRPSGGRASFAGYEVIGSLPPGGSGAKLYLAHARPEKQAQFARAGLRAPDRLVIKAFALDEGSTLPQIVRENRALEAARDLGLVLEHELTPSRFHYVMPFVPGEDLGAVTRGLHAASGGDGLNDTALRAALGYGTGLLGILSRFHRAGLWHKDIKPNNIIVSDARVELVDLGLVTPLASAMTLTTHGTEYYRDPELVRLAMQGVKVQDVDGVKFDLYSAGAVLFNLVENEFPAHGSLSKITRRCPEALRWIIRRAMADLRNRYGSADEMLGDLRVVLAARDPFAVKPAQLPSMGGAPLAADAAGEEFATAGLRPVAPGAGLPTGPGEASDGFRGEQREQPAVRRPRGAPLGARAFIGMTAACLLLAGFLGALFLGAVRVHRSEGVLAPMPHSVVVSTGPGAWALPASDLPPLAPLPPAFGTAGWPAGVPSMPLPSAEGRGPLLLQSAPTLPEPLRSAFDRGALPSGQDWLGDAERWTAQVRHWVEEQQDQGFRFESDEDWMADLEAWACDLECWVDDLEDQFADQRQADDSRRSASRRAAHARVRAAALADRPTPRVLLLATRPALPRELQTEVFTLLQDRLHWSVLSEGPGGTGETSPEDLGRLVRARRVAGFADLGDAGTNHELAAELLEDGGLDAVVRWDLDEELGRPRFHLILRDARGAWMKGELERAAESLEPVAAR
jgi:hypothetical protein